MPHVFDYVRTILLAGPAAAPAPIFDDPLGPTAPHLAIPLIGSKSSDILSSNNPTPNSSPFKSRKRKRGLSLPHGGLLTEDAIVERFVAQEQGPISHYLRPLKRPHLSCLEDTKKAAEAKRKAAERVSKRQRKLEVEASEVIARQARLVELQPFIARAQSKNLEVHPDLLEGKRLPLKKEMKALCTADTELVSCHKASLSVEEIWVALKSRLTGPNT